MKVKVTHCFRDREEDLKLREVGEVFETTRSRAKELKSKGFVEEVTEETEKISKSMKRSAG